MSLLQTTINEIYKADTGAIEEMQVHLDGLLKPPGSLGKLESIALTLAGIKGGMPDYIKKRSIIVMCADNGVVQEGVTSHPSEVSTMVAMCIAMGKGGVSILGKQAGADIKIVDLGLKAPPGFDGVSSRVVRRCTDSILQGPAMSREEAILAIEAGIEETITEIDNGAEIIGTGEVGMGNTTTSSAILHAFSGKDVESLVGRGAGIDDGKFQKKKFVVAEAVKKNAPDPEDALDVLHKVGGLDIAAMTGTYLACASRRVPVVIDGFISGAAAVCALKLCPESVDYMIPSHMSEEPGASVIWELLNLEPMMKMDMRLGEGTGCALAFHLIDASIHMIHEMGLLSDIGL